MTRHCSRRIISHCLPHFKVAHTYIMKTGNDGPHANETWSAKISMRNNFCREFPTVAMKSLYSKFLSLLAFLCRCQCLRRGRTRRVQVGNNKESESGTAAVGGRRAIAAVVCATVAHSSYKCMVIRLHKNDQRLTTLKLEAKRNRKSRI